MKVRYLNSIYAVLSIVLLMAFLYSAKTVYPAIVGKALILCSSCLSFLLPTLQKTFIALLLIALANITVSIIRTLRFRSKLIVRSDYRPLLAKLEKKHALRSKIVVFEDNAPLAFCMGFIKPKIYLSTQLIRIMSVRELETVLLHERQHLIGRDNVVNLLLDAIKNTLFFLPIAGDLITHLQTRKEIHADRGVVEVLGRNDSLIMALRKVIEFPSLRLSTVAAFAQYHDIDYRIRSLLGVKKATYPFRSSSVLLSVCVVLFAANVVVNKIEVHQQIQQESAICFDKGSCQDFCQ